MNKIVVPRQSDALVAGLKDIAKQHFRNDWERAAYVWAGTYREGKEAQGQKHTLMWLASAGIPGLSRSNIQRIRSVWAGAIQDGFAKDLQPGDEMELPTVAFEAIDRTGKRDERGARAVLRDPERTREALKDPVVRQSVAKAVASDRQATRVTERAIDKARIERITVREPKEPEAKPIVPSELLRGIANAAIGLNRDLETLLALAEQNPAVIDVIPEVRNMGGSRDYLRYALAELTPTVATANRVFGRYELGEKKKVEVTA